MISIVKKAKQNFLPLALVAVLLPGLTACTDQEVGTTIGIIAIGAGAAIIVGSNSGNGRREEPRREEPRREPSRPAPVNPGRGVGGGLGGPHRGAVDFGGDSVDSRVVASSIDAEAFADTFGLSNASAQTFLGAMEQAKAGNGQAVLDLGLSSADLDALKDLEMPTNSGIEAVAVSMNADVSVTKAMIRALLKKAVEQKQEMEQKNLDSRI